jgi:hypothetical protein
MSGTRRSAKRSLPRALNQGGPRRARMPKAGPRARPAARSPACRCWPGCRSARRTPRPPAGGQPLRRLREPKHRDAPQRPACAPCRIRFRTSLPSERARLAPLRRARRAGRRRRRGARPPAGLRDPPRTRHANRPSTGKPVKRAGQAPEGASAEDMEARGRPQAAAAPANPPEADFDVGREHLPGVNCGRRRAKVGCADAGEAFNPRSPWPRLKHDREPQPPPSPHPGRRRRAGAECPLWVVSGHWLPCSRRQKLAASSRSAFGWRRCDSCRSRRLTRMAAYAPQSSYNATAQASESPQHRCRKERASHHIVRSRRGVGGQRVGAAKATPCRGR